MIYLVTFLSIAFGVVAHVMAAPEEIDVMHTILLWAIYGVVLWRVIK